MWLVFDIGNSAIKGATFDGAELTRAFGLPHDAAGMADALAGAVEGSPTRAGYASVVPASAERLSRLLVARGLAPTAISHEMRLPFRLEYETPATLGTDRIAAAAAAWTTFGRRQGRSVVALDAGTAVTCEVIDRHGLYLGGTIGPGPALMQRSLHADTAQLPDVALELPGDPIGPSTTAAMQSGIMYGFLDGVDGLLRRISITLADVPLVIATGGWGRLLYDHLEAIDEIDPHLVLRGVRILMENNT